jgi:hypothetical protein
MWRRQAQQHEDLLPARRHRIGTLGEERCREQRGETRKA